jgi:rod shape-determining protein MreB
LGIDLGTATVIIYERQRGLLLKESSVIAVNKKTDKVVAVGDDANKMVGRTPEYIQVLNPLSDGVISNFDMTYKMIEYFIHKVNIGTFIKPRVIICVPGGITEVEANAVVRAASEAGARKVFLIEEPVAAALGAGLDISKPNGQMILDIGGGTSDAAVMSFNGVVCKASVKVAGRKIDEAIAKFIRNEHKLFIGARAAEQIKITIGSAFFDGEDDLSCDVKGRDSQTGMPKKITVKRSELCVAISEPIDAIVGVVRKVLDVTPPELSADLKDNGLLLTGGGALLHGLDRRISYETSLMVRVANNPDECVAKGTVLAFEVVDSLVDGLVNRAIRTF